MEMKCIAFTLLYNVYGIQRSTKKLVYKEIEIEHLPKKFTRKKQGKNWRERGRERERGEEREGERGGERDRERHTRKKRERQREIENI